MRALQGTLSGRVLAIAAMTVIFSGSVLPVSASQSRGSFTITATLVLRSAPLANSDRLTVNGVLPGLKPSAVTRQVISTGQFIYMAIGDAGPLGASPALATTHAAHRFLASRCSVGDQPVLVRCNQPNGDWLTLTRSGPRVVIASSARSTLRGGDGQMGWWGPAPVLQVAVGGSLVQVPLGDCRNRAVASGTRQVCGATSPTTINPAPAVGPISASQISQIYTQPVRIAAQGAAPSGTSAPSSGCGGMYDQVAQNEVLAVGFASMIPTVGPALGRTISGQAIMSTSMGAQAGDSCIEGQISVINQQLSDQEAQIQQLQADAQLAAGTFYQAEFDQSLAITGSYAQQYATSLNGLSPSSTSEGIFGSFMINSGYWQYGNVPTPDYTVASASTGQNFSSAVDAATTGAPAFQSDIANLSGTTLDTSRCTAGNCDAQVAQSPNSQLANLFSSKAQALQTAWLNDISPGGSGGSNVVGNYDQYNNALSTDFQSSLNALQQGLQLETMSNQMNLQYAQANCNDPSTWKSCTQIPSWGDVPGTTFDVSRLPDSVTTWSGVVSAFNADQQQLTDVYGARVNRLFETTLQFITSDAPITPQVYPAAAIPATINGQQISVQPVTYAEELGAALPGVIAGPARTPLGSLPAAAAGSWQTSAALYQFSGLYDATQCAATVLAFNEATNGTQPASDVFPDSSSCPQVFGSGSAASMDGAYYDGDRVQPYYSTGSNIVLTGAMQANLRMCNASSPSFGWYTPPVQNTGNAAGLTSGTWYLNCGNWNRPAYSGAFSCFPNAHCPTSWSDPEPSPWGWVPSQYYGSNGDYPGLAGHNHGLSNKSSVQILYLAGANSTGCDTNLFTYYQSLEGNQTNLNYGPSGDCLSTGTDVRLDFNSPTKNQNTWYQGVVALPTTNQGSQAGGNNLGVSIPVAWKLYYSSNNNYLLGWAPEQHTSMAQYGFTCSGWTCTTTDGAQWNVANPSGGYNNQVTIQLQSAS